MVLAMSQRCEMMDMFQRHNLSDCYLLLLHWVAVWLVTVLLLVSSLLWLHQFLIVVAIDLNV